MNPNQIKRVVKLLKDLKSNQEETIAPIVEANRDDISDLENISDSISETLDVYFWTLVRAQLDGLLNDDENGREDIYQDLIDLQYEYLACTSIANFFQSLS